MASLVPLLMSAGVSLAAGSSLPAQADSGTHTPTADLALSVVGPVGLDLNQVSVYKWNGKSYQKVDAEAASDGSGRLVLAGGCSAGASLLLETKKLVAQPLKLDSGECTGLPVQVKLFPRAELKLSLATEKGDRSPTQAVVAFSRCPAPADPATPAQARLPVAVSPDGTVAATVPSGCTDLSVLTEDFAPLSWWGLQLVAGGVTNLGTARLQAGASLLVRTIDRDDALPLEGASVALVRAEDAERAIRSALVGNLPEGGSGGVTGTRGWLRLSGLADGAFSLIVTAEGHAVACENLTLEHGKQTLIDDLELGRTGSMDVSLSWGGPGPPKGFALTLFASVRLCCHNFFGARSSQVPPSGVAHLAGLNPGSWKLSVALTKPSGRFYTVGDAEAMVASGQSTFVDLRISGRLFHGEVLRGDEPVEADLRLRAVEPRADASEVLSTSQADGSFVVLLPTSGKYDVLVSAQDPTLVTTVPSVPFSDPEKAVEVRLPEGRIVGSVVDEDGNGVADATVKAYLLAVGSGEKGVRGGIHTRSVTDIDGSFVLDAVVPGTWRVTAKQGDLVSDPATVGVASDREETGVTLILQATISQSGAVHFSDGRPAAGVYVWGNKTASDGFPVTAYTTTDATGGFRIRLKAKEGDPASLVVLGDGVAAEPFRTTLSGKDPVDLRVLDIGGRLELSLPLGKERSFGGLVLVRPDGSYLPVAELVGEQLSSSSSDDSTLLTIANLAPGPWTIVDAQHPAVALTVFSGSGAGLPGLAKIVLRRGSVERVTIGP